MCSNSSPLLDVWAVTWRDFPLTLPQCFQDLAIFIFPENLSPFDIISFWITCDKADLNSLPVYCAPCAACLTFFLKLTFLHWCSAWMRDFKTPLSETSSIWQRGWKLVRGQDANNWVKLQMQTSTWRTQMQNLLKLARNKTLISALHFFWSVFPPWCTI